MLRGSSQYTLRYHLTAMPWEIVKLTKHSKIIDFSLGFREAFSLCCISSYEHFTLHKPFSFEKGISTATVFLCSMLSVE